MADWKVDALKEKQSPSTPAAAKVKSTKPPLHDGPVASLESFVSRGVSRIGAYGELNNKQQVVALVDEDMCKSRFQLSFNCTSALLFAPAIYAQLVFSHFTLTRFRFLQNCLNLFFDMVAFSSIVSWIYSLLILKLLLTNKQMHLLLMDWVW